MFVSLLRRLNKQEELLLLLLFNNDHKLTAACGRPLLCANNNIPVKFYPNIQVDKLT